MRLSRHCFRNLRLTFIFGAACFLFVLLIVTRTSSPDISQTPNESEPKLVSNKKKVGNKNWEWSEENLREFMQMLKRDVAKSDSNVDLHISNTSGVELEFPSINSYLPFIQDKHSALRPNYVLSYRPTNYKGK